MTFESQREQLIAMLRLQGINDEEVLSVIATTPREFFVTENFLKDAYLNHALAIERGQTISQPYIVAFMTSLLLQNKKRNKVLEIGTGSGYQAAILARLYKEVYSVERIKFLSDKAKTRFTQLNIQNISLLHGDGMLGWPEHGPYDGIIVTAAANDIPRALLLQLNEGGQLVIPVNVAGRHQVLHVITKKDNEFLDKELLSVVFVPLLGGTEN